MTEQKYIPLDAAIAAIEAIPNGNWKTTRYTKAIEAIPAADVAEVVRCSRCEHWSVDGCDKVGFHTPLNWFCADGERKEEGQDE